MEKVNFVVEKRTNLGSSHSNRLRKQRKVPGVVYGMKKEPIQIQVNLVPLEKLFYTAGESTMIDLDVDGDKADVLIQSVNFHPLTNEIIHVDFLRVDENKKVTTIIPITFTGNSEGVRLGGTLVANKTELEIECLVKDLIHELVADLSLLDEIGSQINIGDLDIPETIIISIPETVVVARVEAPKTISVEEELAAEDAAAAEEVAETEEGEEVEGEVEEEKAPEESAKGEEKKEE